MPPGTEHKMLTFLSSGIILCLLKAWYEIWDIYICLSKWYFKPNAWSRWLCGITILFTTDGIVFQYSPQSICISRIRREAFFLLANIGSWQASQEHSSPGKWIEQYEPRTKVFSILFLPLIDLNGRLYMNVVIMNIKRKPKVAATAIFRVLCSWLSGRRLAAPT